MLANTFLFLLSSVTSAVPALDAVKTKLRHVQSFTVDFEQSVSKKAFAKQPTEVKGKLECSRPSQMRWTYFLEPHNRVVFFDGKALIIREGDEENIVRDGKVNLEQTFSFLWGDADLTNFRIENLTPTSFRVLPRQPDSVPFESLTIEVKDQLVNRVRVVDAIGMESSFEFSDWKLNDTVQKN